jgi:hypothetical protein
MGRVETRKDPAILLPRGGRWQGIYVLFVFLHIAYRREFTMGGLGMGESPGKGCGWWWCGCGHRLRRSSMRAV